MLTYQTDYSYETAINTNSGNISSQSSRKSKLIFSINFPPAKTILCRAWASQQKTKAKNRDNKRLGGITNWRRELKGLLEFVVFGNPAKNEKEKSRNRMETKKSAWIALFAKPKLPQS